MTGDPGWVRITWDEALDGTAARMREGCWSTTSEARLPLRRARARMVARGEPLGLPGYDVTGSGSSNYNALIDTDRADPISGTIPLRSYLGEVRKASS